jgi:hypothetical protein
MSINIKRIIREELSRVLEGDVVHVKFGGEPMAKERPQSDYQVALGKVMSLLEEIINDGGAEMEDDEVVALTDILDQVTELHDDAAGAPDEEEEELPFGRGSSDRERDELSRFKKYMGDRDRDGDY